MVIRRKKEIGLFALFVFINTALFILFAFIVFVICHFVGVNQIPPWGQILVWIGGFAMSSVFLGFKFVRKRFFWILMFTVAMVYLLSLIVIPEEIENQFTNTLQDIVFIAEFLLLPFSVRDAIKLHFGENVENI